MQEDLEKVGTKCQEAKQVNSVNFIGDSLILQPFRIKKILETVMLPFRVMMEVHTWISSSSKDKITSSPTQAPIMSRGNKKVALEKSKKTKLPWKTK